MSARMCPRSTRSSPSTRRPALSIGKEISSQSLSNLSRKSRKRTIPLELQSSQRAAQTSPDSLSAQVQEYQTMPFMDKAWYRVRGSTSLYSEAKALTRKMISFPNHALACLRKLISSQLQTLKATRSCRSSRRQKFRHRPSRTIFRQPSSSPFLAQGSTPGDPFSASSSLKWHHRRQASLLSATRRRHRIRSRKVHRKVDL